MPWRRSLYDQFDQFVADVVPAHASRANAVWVVLQPAVRWMDRLLDGPRSRQEQIWITATDLEFGYGHNLEECVLWWACHMKPLLDGNSVGCIGVEVAALIGPILELRATVTNRLRPVVNWLNELLFSLVDPFWSVVCWV
jgi:hypothetical protein